MATATTDKLRSKGPKGEVIFHYLQDYILCSGVLCYSAFLVRMALELPKTTALNSVTPSFVEHDL